MLVEIAVGDAYGAGFEFAPPEVIERNNDLSGYVGSWRRGDAVGHYTDDTQMALAIAEAILANVDWTPKNLADKFVEVFKRDQRMGYARGFYEFLCGVRDGDDFLARIVPRSERSGSAMRAGPIGVFSDIREVIEKSTIQAAITHDTPNGIRAAVAASLMVYYFLHERGKREDLGRFLEAHVAGRWSEPWQGPTDITGLQCVHAAVTAVSHNSRMSDVLRTSVGFGGDVDTVAAIAMGPAACCTGIEQDLPDCLWQRLEDGPYGRSYLSSIDRRLMERFQTG